MIDTRYTKDQVDQLLAQAWELAHVHDKASDELVDCADIAHLLGVQVATVHRWQVREVMPTPARYFGQSPAWRWLEILAWAIDTKRVSPSAFADTPSA